MDAYTHNETPSELLERARRPRTELNALTKREKKLNPIRQVISKYRFFFHALSQWVPEHGGFLMDMVAKRARSAEPGPGKDEMFVLFPPAFSIKWAEYAEEREHLLKRGADYGGFMQWHRETEEEVEESIRFRMRKINAVKLETVLNQLVVVALALIIEKITNKKDEASYLAFLGMLLPHLKLGTLPPKYMHIINEHLSDTEATVERSSDAEKRLFLCGTSEPRMEHSVQNNMTMLVDDRLLMKFEGKVTALCLQSFVTKDRKFTFVRGGWYSPATSEDRQYFKDAYQQGVTRIKSKKIHWQFVREAEHEWFDNNEKDLNAHARGLPERLSEEDNKRRLEAGKSGEEAY